jgi:hypothetical protein
MKITKSGVQSLEIFGKLFNFRFEYLNPNSIKDDELLCDHCPLLCICDKIPDPRRLINPKKFDKRCLNDFCLIPSPALYGESVRTILANLSGQVFSEDQMLEYLRKKDYIDRCLDLGFLKKVGGNKFEVIDYTKTDLIEKEESLSITDKEFLSEVIGRWELQDMDEAEDLIPVKEDVIKYIKEVVINFIKFKPFTPVIYKNTGKTGLVKEITSNGILVLFDNINEQPCKVEELELLEKQEDSGSEYKPFDLVLCKPTGQFGVQWGVVKKSTKDMITVNGFDLENYIDEEELFYKPEDLELL